MRLYLDTEFNGFGGELISMALVLPPNEKHPILGPNSYFYQAQFWKKPTNSWVKENVVPKLEIKPVAPKFFRKTFHNWIKHFDNPEIICDWYADAEHFARALEGENYDSSLDFNCRISIIKTPPGQPVPDNPHNALSDARALCVWHQSL